MVSNGVFSRVKIKFEDKEEFLIKLGTFRDKKETLPFWESHLKEWSQTGLSQNAYCSNTRHGK